ncbi:uncharacterized protein LOC143276417 [Babylonia areolata]|uniref:uncharacterized protein LOC143276417 n=1 Tax=Babylonia areolata TaxID=304850 RepID=UPI003FD52A4B
MTFASRQIQEKCQDQHSVLFMIFVDLTEAFNTVSREGLWKILEKFGCPSKFITIVRQFHDGMMVKVLDDGDESEAFQVTNSVKQGCVLAQYGSVRTEQNMQGEMDCFSQACSNFGLTISTKKTKVMFQHAQGKTYQEPRFTLKGQNLQAVDFTYLGSTWQAKVSDTEVMEQAGLCSIDTLLQKAQARCDKLRWTNSKLGVINFGGPTPN